MSASRILRNRQADSSDDLDRIGSQNRDDGEASLLVQTFTEATYPTTAQAAYACHELGLDGSESEGATPSVVADTGVTLYAFNLGSRVPPSGTNLVIHHIGARWCFRYDG